MSESAEYRKRAAECEALARLISRHDERAAMLDIARHWTALAEAAERQEPVRSTD